MIRKSAEKVLIRARSTTKYNNGSSEYLIKNKYKSIQLYTNLKYSVGVF